RTQSEEVGDLRSSSALRRAARLRSAVPVERVDEILSDLFRRAPFDLPALDHVHELAVLEQTDLRRRRRIPREIRASPRRGFGILTGKYGRRMIGLDRILERDRDGRP